MLEDKDDERAVKMSLILDMRMDDPALSNPKMFETEVFIYIYVYIYIYIYILTLTNLRDHP